MLIYHTPEKFIAEEQKICNAMGYPDEHTKNYYEPREVLIEGQTRWIMPKHPNVEVEFDEELEFNESWVSTEEY